MPTRMPFILATTALATTALTATTASADVVQAFYQTGGPYGYKITHMPDIDQRRDNLPNNGSMYCVPTAAINLYMYAANHGFPFVEPGAGNWQSNALYDEAEDAVIFMGALMGTDGVDGTSGSGATLGYTNWTNWYTGGLFDCKIKYRSSSYTPTIRKMSKLACQGWILSFTYGRYDVVGYLGDVPILDRDGGHAVTLTRTYSVDDTRILRYRDPANDSANLTTQSPFVNKECSYVGYTAVFDLSPLIIQTMSRMLIGDDGKVRLVDSYRGIRPKFGIAFGNTGDSAVGGAISYLNPLGTPGAADLTMPEIPVPPGQTLLDLHLDADGVDALALLQAAVGGPAQLQRVDLVTGEFTPTGAPGGLKGFCPSPYDEFYGFDAPGKLYWLAADGAIKSAISSNPAPSALWFNDHDDQLVLFSVSARRLNRYSRSLDQLISSYVIPMSVPLAGDGSVTVDPTSGRAWFCSAASDSLYGVYGNGPLYSLEIISLPAIQNPVAVRGSADGHLFVACDAGIVEIAPGGDARGGGWVVVADSAFAGLPASARFSMLTSGDNYEPDQHGVPGWSDIPADELGPTGVDVPECTGDLNGDDAVDGADIGLLLAGWGVVPVGTVNYADIDANGVIDGADLGLLLSQWGDCL